MPDPFVLYFHILDIYLQTIPFKAFCRGFRFVRAAADRNIPIAAVNLGRTRADDLLSLKVEAPCDEALAFLLEE